MSKAKFTPEEALAFLNTGTIRMLDGRDRAGRKICWMHKKGPVECIRQGDWKLQRKVKHRKKGEPKVEGPPVYVHRLYNLATDLAEENDVAEAHPERVEVMVKRMLELDAEIEANARPVWGKP